jgi:3-oxoacyl-ACP reductase-like protein
LSIFGKIKDAIFGKKAAPAPTGQAQAPTGTTSGGATAAPPSTAQPQPQPQAAVDVEQVLVSIAKSKGNPNLNWRTSIVDLMKLLDLDSSLENRKELATELGYTGDKDGSAEMNIWLHQAVMRELANHGGKVPANLAD